MDPRDPIAFDPYSSERGIDDELEIQRQAKEEADRLGRENQEAISGIVEGQSARGSGTTNYGQEVEQPVGNAIARNQTQRDVEIAASLARREGETARDHLDRLALDPNAELNRVYMEERINRETGYYAPRASAMREVLSRGIQNIKDPSVHRMAVEFAQRYPAEYAAMKREMRRNKSVDPAIIAQAQKDLESGLIADRAAEATAKERQRSIEMMDRRRARLEKRWEIKQKQHADGRLTDTELDRERQKYTDGIAKVDFDRRVVTQGLTPDERRERREQKLQRREDVTRQLAARSIGRRIARGGDPNRLLTGYNTGGADRGRYLSPIEVGVLPPRPPRAGEITDSPDGTRRTQSETIPSTDGGPDTQEMRDVPVVETQFGEAIIDAGAMNREQFGKFYTRGDRQRISEQIYMSGGEMARRQRQIDSARTAMLDGFLTDEDRAQAEQDLTQKEQDLHYEYARRQGGKRTVIRGGKAGKGSGKESDPTMGTDLLEEINRIEGTEYQTTAEAAAGLGRRFREVSNEAKATIRGRMEDAKPISLDEVPGAPDDMESRQTTPIQLSLFQRAASLGLLGESATNEPIDRVLMAMVDLYRRQGPKYLERVVGAITGNREIMADFTTEDVVEFMAELFTEPERFVGGVR